MTKPEKMEIIFENIPSELIERPQWVLWRWEERGGEWTKPPRQPNGFHASSDKPETWSSFEAVRMRLNVGGYDGIGFVMSKDDPYVGVDFDDSRDLATGLPKPWAKDLIEELASYTEVSPSGRGFKSLVKAKLPGPGHHGEEVGIFDRARYFCITGNLLNGWKIIENRQEVINNIIRQRWPQDFQTRDTTPPPPSSNGLSDEQILARAFKDPKFTRLWNGDISGYPSQSEADSALIMKLLFFTGKDAQRADALFRQSGLMREKWNRESYGQRTIEHALAIMKDRKGDGRISLEHVYDAGRMLKEYEGYVQNLEEINFKTGVKQIDQKIRGVAGGEVLTIIARAGCFKTATLQNMLKNYIQNSSLGAAFFSLEMPIPAVAERYHEIISGYMGYEVEATYRSNASHIDVLQKKFISELKGLYVIPVRVSLGQVRDYVRLIEDHYKIKIGVIGIDYLGLLDGRGQNQYEIISRLARETKTLAKEMSLPVVLLAQTSRRAGTGDTEISLDMGRDSGVIEEGADFIIGLFQVEREVENGEPEYDLIAKILKNRKGPRNSMWKLNLNPQTLYLESEAFAWKPAKKDNNGADL